MKKIIALFAATATLLTAAAPLASAASLALGTREARLNGAIDFDSPAGTALALEAGYGYFVADYIQVGGIFGFANDDFVSSFSLGGFAEFNIETDSEVIPFVGSQVRLVNAEVNVGPSSSSETALTLGLYAGTKIFLTDELAIAVRMLIETATEDIYVEEDDVSNLDLVLDIGLRYFF
jgi:opacity protein-like surface antigen